MALEVFGGCSPNAAYRLTRVPLPSFWVTCSLITTAADDVDAPPVVYIDSLECGCLFALPEVPTECVVFKNSLPFLPKSWKELGSLEIVASSRFLLLFREFRSQLWTYLGCLVT